MSNLIRAKDFGFACGAQTRIGATFGVARRRARRARGAWRGAAKLGAPPRCDGALQFWVPSRASAGPGGVGVGRCLAGRRLGVSTSCVCVRVHHRAILSQLLFMNRALQLLVLKTAQSPARRTRVSLVVQSARAGYQNHCKMWCLTTRGV